MRKHLIGGLLVAVVVTLSCATTVFDGRTWQFTVFEGDIWARVDGGYLQLVARTTGDSDQPAAAATAETLMVVWRDFTVGERGELYYGLYDRAHQHWRTAAVPHALGGSAPCLRAERDGSLTVAFEAGPGGPAPYLATTWANGAWGPVSYIPVKPCHRFSLPLIWRGL